MDTALQQNTEAMDALKLRFADAFLRKYAIDTRSDWFAVSRDILGYDQVGPALQLGNQMFACYTEIEELMTELVAKNGEAYYAPTKLQFAREILNVARTMFDERAKAQMYRNYADVRGFIEKPGDKSIVNDNSTRVIEVYQFDGKTIEGKRTPDWIDAARSQQLELTTAG